MRRLWLASILVALPVAATAFTFTEPGDGELSGDRLVPTSFVAALGANTLIGTTIAGDLEYVHISLPSGYELASLILNSVTSADDVAFIALQQGTTFSVAPAGATPGVLLGYGHFGTGPLAGGATPGNDMLDDLCTAADAIGCLPPLGASDYTFWIQQTGAQSYGYSLNFVVIPEPGSFVLLGLGVLGVVGWRRLRVDRGAISTI